MESVRESQDLEYDFNDVPLRLALLHRFNNKEEKAMEN